MNISTPLYITGVQPETQRFMYGGFFRMHDEIGFPIDCCIDEAKDRKMLIDWLEALCDCWLNDCLKYNSFVRQVSSQLPDLTLDAQFKEAGACVLAMFPKMRETKNPVDVVCRYILAKKKRHLALVKFYAKT